jgi:DNA uptake protein ComE-like DNA-binding protein
MASGDRHVASDWLPVELALPETEASDQASENGAPDPADHASENGEPSTSPDEAGIERLLERAEQAQGALHRAEVRIEGAEERTRLLAQAESALQRATAAEEMAREAAEVADRLSAKLIVLTDRIAAQEIELKRQRWQRAAVVDDEHQPEPQPLPEPKPEPELEPQAEPDQGLEPVPEPEAEPELAPEPEPEVSPPPQLQHQRPQEAAFDINEASFDRLCKLGLSVSQAARLIGQRDQRGGFSSIDELDHLRGLPPDMIEMLKHAASG